MKEYEELKMEVLVFEEADIITESPPNHDTPEIPFEP